MLETFSWRSGCAQASQWSRSHPPADREHSAWSQGMWASPCNSRHGWRANRRERADQESSLPHLPSSSARKGPFQLRVIQEISCRLDEALRHHFQIWLLLNHAWPKHWWKYWERAERKMWNKMLRRTTVLARPLLARQNRVWGTTHRHGSQSTSLKRASTNQSQDAASSDTISVQPHFGRISRVMSKKACQATSFLVVMRFVFFFPHRGNADIRHHVPEFQGSLRPEQTRLYFMCLPWKSLRKDDHETTEQWRNRCSFAENTLDEEFVLWVSLQIFVKVQEQLNLLHHKRVRARVFPVFPTGMRARSSRVQTVSSLCFMVLKKIYGFNWKTLTWEGFLDEIVFFVLTQDWHYGATLLARWRFRCVFCQIIRPHVGQRVDWHVFCDRTCGIRPNCGCTEIVSLDAASWHWVVLALVEEILCESCLCVMPHIRLMRCHQKFCQNRRYPKCSVPHRSVHLTICSFEFHCSYSRSRTLSSQLNVTVHRTCAPPPTTKRFPTHLLKMPLFHKRTPSFSKQW